MRPQREELLVVLDKKPLQQEWRVDPRPIEIGNEHADLEVVHEDLGRHGLRILRRNGV